MTEWFAGWARGLDPRFWLASFAEGDRPYARYGRSAWGGGSERELVDPGM